MYWSKSRIIKTAVVVLVVVCLCAGGYLLSRQRYKTSGLPDVEELPTTSGIMVGNTVLTSFLKLSQEVDGPIPFFYLYDPSTGRDCLVVFQLPKILFPSIEPTNNENRHLAHSSVSLATFMEPDWDGLQGFTDHLTEKRFDATVIHTVYVSYVETGNIFHSTSIPSVNFHPEEKINPLAQPLPVSNAPGLQVYLGQVSQEAPEEAEADYWTELENGTYVYLIGNMAQTESERFTQALSSFVAIAYRYDLHDYLLGMTSDDS